MKRPSVRARLLFALAFLAVSTLALGAVSWAVLSRSTERLEALHRNTLAEVDRALTLSRRGADLATLAPYLLTLTSPFRIRQEGAAAEALIDEIAKGLPEKSGLQDQLGQSRAAIGRLVRETARRAGLRDRGLRINADLADAERRFAALAAPPEPAAAPPETGTAPPATAAQAQQDWLVLQRLAAALLGAGRAENLIGVGEFHREYVGLLARVPAAMPQRSPDLARLRAMAEGPEGLFELRRLELASQIRAEAALVRIRQGAAAVTAYSAATTAEAQANIAAERARTATSMALAKSAILAIGLASAALALMAALFVSGHVTANLRLISDAMMRLAAGDRQSRLPRGENAGDEIGKLFHAFRAFRANALRLDRSHRQMAQRGALYENMMAGMSDGMAILSEQGTVLAQNPRLAQVLRVEPAALQGRPVLAGVMAAAGWTLSHGPGGYADLARPDGLRAEARESALPGGGTVVLISDATERRQLDDRLRQIQRIEALGKVSGEVAHDFGNILSTISGSLHLMDSAAPARQAALRQTLAGAVDLGMSLTQRLLSFARRQQLEPETVDLAGLIEGLADLIGFALRDEITLTLELPPAPLLVRVDPGQLESALLNLCLNAGQAIDGPGQITLSLGAEAGQAVISVRDTGIGMTAEVLAHAMEPFFSARRDGTGTGLGLAMVYGFIRQSGGDVTLTSAEGRGTTVRLCLPLCQQTEPGARASIRLGRVLLVEDDPADMARAQAILAPRAQELICCPDADAARGLLAGPQPFEQPFEQPFDLLVTDLTLQNRPAGWDLARLALAQAHPTRVLVVSGHLPDIVPPDMAAAPRLACLAKPLAATALLAALSDLTQDPPPPAGRTPKGPPDDDPS